MVAPQFFQSPVSDFMATGVVDLFEMIDVQKKNRKGQPIPPGPLHLFGKSPLKIATVVYPHQGIGNRLLFEGVHPLHIPGGCQGQGTDQKNENSPTEKDAGHHQVGHGGKAVLVVEMKQGVEDVTDKEDKDKDG